MAKKIRIIEASVNWYRFVIGMMLAVTLGLAFIAVLPSLWPGAPRSLHRIRVDTDPENMLSPDEPVRVLHNKMKKVLGLHDMVVVGVVNEVHPAGVFNPVSLGRIYELTQYAKTLRWRDKSGKWGGVIEADLIAPSTVDNMEPGGPGEVKFSWLMSTPPDTQEEALEIRRKAKRIPFLNDTLISGDGRAIGLYLPLTAKDLSYRVYDALSERIPVLWVWAPLKADLKKLAGQDGAADTIIRLSRLVAFHAKDKESFKQEMTALATAISAAPADGAETVSKALKQWGGAQGDDGASQAAGSESTKGLVRFLKSRLRAEKGPTAVWFRLAGYYAASMQASGLDAGQLASETAAFVQDASRKIAAQAPRLSSLPVLVAADLRPRGQLFDPDKFYITGLPVAEDTFGVEMFMQMAISAPVAMLVIFILMLVFFRKLIIVTAPMILALVAVIITMSLLVISGFPIHIMSSMIPIFIMPIAVLNSVHIISEFFERYQLTKDPKETILAVMDHLFLPMLYTSLTTVAGFASLALTPIPPVQVFGVYVAIGIALSWFLTMTFIPAFVMLIPRRMLDDFGAGRGGKDAAKSTSQHLARFLTHLGAQTYRHSRVIVALTLVIMCVGVWGISLIKVNDNPVKWFDRSHPIREADRVLNKHFGGTYMAYLAMQAKDDAFDASGTAGEIAALASKRAEDVRDQFSKDVGVDEVFAQLGQIAHKVAETTKSSNEYFDALAKAVKARGRNASGETSFVWDEALSLVEQRRQASSEVFKSPAVLAWQEQVQQVMVDTGIVGKSNSLADIVKTVYRDLVGGHGDKASANFRIPANRRMVAETLMQFQNGHRPGDLWHFVTPDYRLSSIWVQLKSGDNRNMSRVKNAVDTFVANYPPPVPMKVKWFGLTYINVVWQKKMVIGMLQAFSGSFLVVFLLMLILFRSTLWAVLSMLPLTITIGAIYGAIGIMGKDYDMPVAILSSMAIGLAVDFAIHFLARGRVIYAQHASWQRTCPLVFDEPARAIARNIIVIAVGFLPLILAPLVPYKTVGVFLATILFVGGLTTLLLLPALVKIFEKRLFAPRPAVSPACDPTYCSFVAASVVGTVALTLHQYVTVGWGTLTWMSVVVIALLSSACVMVSKIRKCRVPVTQEDTKGEEK